MSCWKKKRKRVSKKEIENSEPIIVSAACLVEEGSREGP